MSVMAAPRAHSGPSLAWPRALTRPVAVALGALLLCWAAVVNGQAFFHPDSISYIRGPDVAVMKLFGERYASPWARHDPGSRDPAPAGAKAAAASDAKAKGASYNDDEVMGGRSIYYGALAYLGAITGGFWLTVFVQGLGVSVLADITLRALGQRRLSTYAAVMGGLALLTPAPLFVALLMPDIWAGVAFGAAAALFAFSGRLKLIDTLILAALVAFGALAHNSAILVLAGLVVLGGAAWLGFRRTLPDMRPALAILVVGIVVALAGNALFSLMVQRSVGKPPLMPPFLTARLVADGPGARYIREKCHGEFVVCRFAATGLPTDVDDFLWATEPGKAVFETADAPTRRALADEQTRFAVAVVRAYPLQQAAATLRNMVAQTGTFELKDFDYPAAQRANLQGSIPEPALTRFRHTAAYAEAWPLQPLWALQMATTLASLAAAAWLLFTGKSDPLTDDRRQALVFLGFVAVALLLNAAACGALTSVNGRYMARAIWALPLAVFLLAATTGRLRLEGPLKTR